MPPSMTTQAVESALKRLGQRIEFGREVEILLVGGAAGMVTGVLPPTRVTTDCDVMVYAPETAMAAVEMAAEQVAQELGLAKNWMNSDVQIRRDTLPDGWQQRKQWVGDYGLLRVSAASRIDLIAMKVLAGRDQDIEDLHALKVREDDAVFVMRYLERLNTKATPPHQIEDARLLLAVWERHEDE